MSNNYKNKGFPFTGAIAEELLNYLQGGEYLIEQAGELLLQQHLNLEGFQPETELSEIFRSAFYLLGTNGRTKRVPRTDEDVWEIFPEGQRIFRSENGAVYCFYDPRDREDAEAKNENRCPFTKTIWNQ